MNGTCNVKVECNGKDGKTVYGILPIKVTPMITVDDIMTNSHPMVGKIIRAKLETDYNNKGQIIGEKLIPIE